MKVALHAGVSSDEQREKETVQNQLEFLRKYVDLYHHQVYKEYIDDGVTRKILLHDRPYAKDLLHDAREKRFHVVLFYKLDRFSRKLRHVLDTYDTLESYDVSIISATEKLDTSRAKGRFAMQVTGAAAELEREPILERTSLRRDRARRNGKAHGGALPFGYTVSEDHKIILGQDSSIAKEIFQRVGNGEILSEVFQC
jgi:site-specific DNA recombinase